MLERELTVQRGAVAPPSSASSTSSASPSAASSVFLSMSSSNTSTTSKPSSSADSNGGVELCGENVEDLEMEDVSVESEARECSREGGVEGVGELRGRRLARTRNKVQTHTLGLGEASMEIEAAKEPSSSLSNTLLGP